jgi:hypothetical protein
MDLKSGLYKVQWDIGEAFTSKQTSQLDTQRLGVYIAPFLIGNLWDVKKILGTVQFIAFFNGYSVWRSGLGERFGWGKSTNLAVVASNLVEQVQYHCDSGLNTEYNRKYERKMSFIGSRAMYCTPKRQRKTVRIACNQISWPAVITP